MMTLGMRLLKTSLLSVEPSISVSSSSTILTTFCAGDSDSMTSAVMQRSLVLATNSLTTLKLTSASSSAMRMSRMAEVISASVSLPLPRRRSNVSLRRSLRESNTSHSLVGLAHQGAAEIFGIELLQVIDLLAHADA